MFYLLEFKNSEIITELQIKTMNTSVLWQVYLCAFQCYGWIFSQQFIRVSSLTLQLKVKYKFGWKMLN